MYGILRTFFIGGFTTLRPIVLEIKESPEIQLEIKIKFERSSYCMAHLNLKEIVEKVTFKVQIFEPRPHSPNPNG